MRTSLALLFMRIFAVYIASGIGIVLVVMCLVNIAGGHAATVPPILPLLFLVLLLPTIMWISGWYGFRRLKLLPNEDPVMTFQANGASFSRRIDKMGEITWLWSATHRVMQDKRMVVIAVRKGCFIYIPRHAITDADVSKLERFLLEAKQPRC
jgi:hypothetical protein